MTGKVEVLRYEAVEFETDQFAEEYRGWINNYSEYAGGENRSGVEIIDLVARNYSISPRVLLALSEYLAGSLSKAVLSESAQDFPLGFRSTQYNENLAYVRKHFGDEAAGFLETQHAENAEWFKTQHGENKEFWSGLYDSDKEFFSSLKESGLTGAERKEAVHDYFKERHGLVVAHRKTQHEENKEHRAEQKEETKEFIEEQKETEE